MIWGLKGFWKFLEIKISVQGLKGWFPPKWKSAKNLLRSSKMYMSLFINQNRFGIKLKYNSKCSIPSLAHQGSLHGPLQWMGAVRIEFKQLKKHHNNLQEIHINLHLVKEKVAFFHWGSVYGLWTRNLDRIHNLKLKISWWICLLQH